MQPKQDVIGVSDKLSLGKAIPLSLQHLMAFVGGGAILPAVLMGLDPALAIMCTGLGTIIYLICTKNKIPSYFGVSFSFITPMAVITAVSGIQAALCGIVAVGVVFVIVAGIVKLVGTKWIDVVLPPAVSGCIIVVIGVGLSATAVDMVLNNGTGEFDGLGCLVAFVTFLAAVAFSSFCKGFLKTIPILLAIIVGYVVAFACGMIDFSPVSEAAWIGLPNITLPVFDLNAILVIGPIAFVVIVEHIGHLLVVSNITGENYNDKLAASLLGNGLGTAVSGFLGGPALTSIAENIGIMGVSRVYSTRVFWYTAGFALVLGGFCPKLAMLINTIPTCVLGGVSLMLFGLIAGNGLSLLVDSKVDFSKNRNLMIAAGSLIPGIGMMTMGVSIPLGSFNLPGLLLASILAVVFNLVLPKEDEAGDAAGETAGEAVRKVAGKVADRAASETTR